MNIDHQLVGELAGVLSTIGFLPYAWSVLRGPTVPSKASWIIWTILGLILLLSYHTAGAQATLWVPVSYAICPALILALACYKNRAREVWPRIDRVCLTSAGILFAPWISFKFLENAGSLPAWGWTLPLISLYGGIILDGLGAVPTIWKAWTKPETENLWGWSFWTAGNLLNLLAVETWSWPIGTYAVYMALPVILILPALVHYRWQSKRWGQSSEKKGVNDGSAQRIERSDDVVAPAGADRNRGRGG